MVRFLVLTGLLVIVSGLVMHYNIQVPAYLEWVGTLPGDIIIKKKNNYIFFPLMSSCLISLAISFVLSALFKSGK